MRVKIGDNWYDSEDSPICIELSDQDKENIKNMSQECKKYASFPKEDKRTNQEKYEWMD